MIKIKVCYKISQYLKVIQDLRSDHLLTSLNDKTVKSQHKLGGSEWLKTFMDWNQHYKRKELGLK